MIDALVKTSDNALLVVNGMDAIDRARVSGAIGSVNALTAALLAASEMARNVAADIAALEDAQDDAEAGFPVQTPGPGTPRPRNAPRDIDFDLPPEVRTRSGGGGGRAAPSEFQRAAQAIRDRIADLEAEGAALLAAAAAGMEYEGAIAYAYQRARLLNAAMRDGIEITPDFAAEIDRLAESHVAASAAARETADAMREAQANAEAGAEAVANLFMGIVQGATARRALAQLLQQMAMVQAQRAFGMLAGMGVPVGMVPGTLGSLTRREHGGSVRAGQPCIVGEKRAELFVPNQSGTILPSVPTGRGQVDVSVRVHVDENGNWKANVEKIADGRVRKAAPQIVRQSVQATYAANSERRMP